MNPAWDLEVFPVAADMLILRAFQKSFCSCADRIKTLHPKNCVNCGTRALHEAVMCLFLRLRLPSHCHQVRWWNIENGSIRTWFWRPWDTHIKIPQTIVMALIFFFHTSTYNPANSTYSVYFFTVWCGGVTKCYVIGAYCLSRWNEKSTLMRGWAFK